VKVLHIAAGVLFGGVETLLVTLAKLRHLCTEMEPHFGLCFPGQLRDALHASSVPVHDLGLVRVSRPWTVLWARKRLKRLLQDKGIEVVVTHGMWPHAVFAPRVKRSGVRLVAAIHDILDGQHWVNRWAARTRPDAIAANSHFTASPAAALFSQPAPVLRYPVAPRSCDRIADRSAMREQLGTPPDAVVILQASRLERWKGQAVHVEALGRLKQVPGWEAWFAGGPQKAGEQEFLTELEASAARLGVADRVKFLGQRSDVPQLMAAADVYCQPNTGPEPFGISFVEALYAGLPVVASETGGPIEIVTAECGTLCPPGNAGAVAKALGELIANADRRQTLSATGPTRAAELCDPTRQLAELAAACGATL
jgi:glycosyltransferase involved in cell wall biosynthesis